MMFWLMRRVGKRVLRSPPPVLRVIVLLAAVLAYGSTGFLFFELPSNPALSWADAIWYSLVTITTVGYGDLYPVSPAGRFFVAFPLMFFGIGLLGYVLSLAASSLVEAKSKEVHGMADIRLRDHLIICNYPSLDTVARLIDELAADGSFRDRDVVIIDAELPELPVALQRRKDPEVRFVKGNPASGAILAQANIAHARDAVVLAQHPGDASSDAQNVVITLAIEDSNPKVHTVTQCIDPATREVLVRARCDGIVCTSMFDVQFLTQELLDPGASGIVAELTTNLAGEQIYVTPFRGVEPTNFEVAAAACRRRGHLAIGIRSDGSNRLNPESSAIVAPGDAVISIGPSRLQEIVV